MPDSQPALETTVIIELKFSKRSEKEAIMKALIPDNINFPVGLSMEMVSKNKTSIIIKFTSNSEIGSLINTIDEVLEHICLAKRVIIDA